MNAEIEKFHFEGGEFSERSRRLRGNPVLREMVRETRIMASCLLYPMFVTEGHGIREEIQAMPGQYRYSVDEFLKELTIVADSGVPGILLFGIPDHKDACGSGAWAEDGIIQKALRAAKREFPRLYCVTDVCMCEYTSHGHCGILCGHDVDNDRTLTVLAKTALSHVQAGADMVAPSDMMDFRVAAIRQTLDRNGYADTPIMAYSAKYASAFYGPFREAAGSAPSFGDRKTYQMDYHNRKEALKEVLQDVREGADIVMVKPGMSYLDIVREVTDAVDVPTAVYSVSGEYAMIKAAAAAGYIDEAAVVCESAVGMRRAGASILITYFAKELAGYIREGRIG
ncbi:MAG: porphobilinogen synthase [Lachnospiraceae bacterium]|nr:porphobilinogen synthase [Lachnospiraceae bacterium]